MQENRKHAEIDASKTSIFAYIIIKILRNTFVKICLCEQRWQRLNVLIV